MKCCGTAPEISKIETASLSWRNREPVSYEIALLLEAVGKRLQRADLATRDKA
jgi:hypothetical protein